MMNFDEFLEAAKNRVQETLPDAEVKIQQVNKLQGESYTGISVQPEGAAAAVTFNVSPAFERYQDDESQKEAILGKIAADARLNEGEQKVRFPWIEGRHVSSPKSGFIPLSMPLSRLRFEIGPFGRI